MHAALPPAEEHPSHADDSGHHAPPSVALSIAPRRLTRRSIRLLQLALLIGLVGAIGAAYWLRPGVHAEGSRAMAVLVSGDGKPIGEYLDSYGIWAPVASIFLMVLQAVPAPVP